MDSFLFTPVMFFFPLPRSGSAGEARQQERSQTFGQTRHAHQRNTHDTDDFTELK